MLRTVPPREMSVSRKRNIRAGLDQQVICSHSEDILDALRELGSFIDELKLNIQCPVQGSKPGIEPH